MPNYKLSKAVECDLFEIAVFGFINFGEKQSDKYNSELKEKFQAIADNPLLFPIADTKSGTFRKCVFKKQTIYFIFENNLVTIIRIIGMQDF